jgi:hypothetical protein
MLRAIAASGVTAAADKQFDPSGHRLVFKAQHGPTAILHNEYLAFFFFGVRVCDSLFALERSTVKHHRKFGTGPGG